MKSMTFASRQAHRVRNAAGLGVAAVLVALCAASVAFGQVGSTSASPGTADLTATRPDPEGVPTPVAVTFYLVDIESIDDPKQEFTADLYIVGRWRDPRLAATDATGGGGIRTLPLSRIWQPDLGIVNRRSLQAMLTDVARVDAQCNVEYAQRVRGQFDSPLDLRRFPSSSSRRCATREWCRSS